MRIPFKHSRAGSIVVRSGVALLLTAGLLSASSVSASAAENYPSCNNAQTSWPDGLLTIKRNDLKQFFVTKKGYAIQAELFPPYGSPGWGMQKSIVNIYVNGKITANTIGKTKPSSEVLHGRLNFTYKNPGDADWTDHRLKGGDVIRIAWVGILTGTDKSVARVYGQLHCKV